MEFVEEGLVRFTRQLPGHGIHEIDCCCSAGNRWTLETTLLGTLGLDPWFGFDMGTIHWIFRVPDGGGGSLTVGRHPVVPSAELQPSNSVQPLDAIRTVCQVPR